MPADLSNEEAQARRAIIAAICERTSLALRGEGDGRVSLVDVFGGYRTAIRATLLASLIEKVEAERPVLTTASTVVDAAYHEAYCRFLTLLRTEAENG